VESRGNNRGFGRTVSVNLFLVVVVPFSAVISITQSPLAAGVPESVTMPCEDIALIPGGGSPWAVTFAPGELIGMLTRVPSSTNLDLGMIIRGIDGGATDAVFLAGEVGSTGRPGRRGRLGC
jgi:hypothetical protein